MSQTRFGNGACCPPQTEGLTYLKVGARGVVVGMMNLDGVFKQLLAVGRRPEEATDAELLGMARKFNHIPDRPTVEADYAVALRQAYRGFYARQEKGRERAARSWGTISVKPDCSAPSRIRFVCKSWTQSRMDRRVCAI